MFRTSALLSQKVENVGFARNIGWGTGKNSCERSLKHDWLFLASCVMNRRAVFSIFIIEKKKNFVAMCDKACKSVGYLDA